MGGQNSGRIRVVLLDDHVVFRQGLARLLNNEPDIEVKLHCGTVEEALFIVAANLADVVLLDLDLGVERGVDFLVAARGIGFTGQVLVLTAAAPEPEMALLKRHGVYAILTKSVSVQTLVAHIREAAGAIPPDAPVSASRNGNGTRAHADGALTERESRVLRMVFQGLENKEIAALLGASETAIKGNLQQLFRKTGTHTRSQLVFATLERYRDQL